MQLPSLIGHAQEVLAQFQSSNRPADKTIEVFFRSRKYLGSHDRRFIAETAYGVLRHMRLCDFLVQTAMSGREIKVSTEEGLTLLIASYLIHIEHRTDIQPDSLSAKLKNEALKSDLPAILQSLNNGYAVNEASPFKRVALQHSFPDWMVERLVNQHGLEEAEKLCQSLNEQAPMAIRVNTLQATVEKCREALQKEGIETEVSSLSPVGLLLKKRVNVFQLKAFKEGMFEVQDIGSQLLPILIDPKPTAKVLDACAGAGGKALEFAALMKNRGEIFATDVNKHRMEELKKRARRAGAFNIRPKHIDSLGELGKTYPEYFDVVLVDAPCTGVGTIRRNPGMKWSVSEEMVKELSEKQHQILRACAPLVKKGGWLVYATCSLFKEENEDVVERFLEEASGYSTRPQPHPLDGQNTTLSGFVYLLPHRHGTDGFFCGVLERSVS